MNGAGAGIGRLRGQLATLTLALREILTVVQNGQSYLRYLTWLLHKRAGEVLPLIEV